MQPHTQLRHLARTLDGIGGRAARYHKARRRQNSAAMRRLDRFIDLVRRPEIIRGHNQALHAASLTTGSTDPSRATSKLSSRHWTRRVAKPHAHRARLSKSRIGSSNSC